MDRENAFRIYIFNDKFTWKFDWGKNIAIKFKNKYETLKILCYDNVEKSTSIPCE